MTAPVGRLGPVPDPGSVPPTAPSGPPVSGRRSPADAPARGASRSAPEVLAAICPFLVASNGAWRAAIPTRDHRCGAQDPPGRLSLDKQQLLCLTSAHLGCPLFEAAAGSTVGLYSHDAARNASTNTTLEIRRMSADGEDEVANDPSATQGSDRAQADRGPIRRPMPRTTPVVMDRARPLADVHMPSVQV